MMKAKKIHEWFAPDIDVARVSLAALRDASKVSLLADDAGLLLESITNETNEYLIYDSQIIRMFDNEIASAYQKEPTNKEIMDELQMHLRFLAVATDNTSGMESYDENEMSDILTGDLKKYDERRFVHTLRQSVHAENRHNIALLLLIHLKDADWTTAFSFTDALIQDLMLNILWSDFMNLPIEGQETLLTQHFYQAIVMGVPVADGIKDSLYFTTTAVQYFLLCQRFYEYLTASNELIPLSPDGKDAQPFGAVLLTHTDRAGDAAGDKAQIQAFVEDVYSGQPKATRLKEWLTKTLELYFAIKEARLIEKTLGGETSDADAYENELKQLIQYFFDPKIWQNIGAYYKKAKPLVSIENFLQALPTGIDLSKDNAPGFLADFAEFLHTERLLPEKVDLVEFHEKDGTFHWNERFV